jgi:hypothetical protein
VVSKVPDRDLLPVGTQVYYYGTLSGFPEDLYTGIILRVPLNKYYALSDFRRVFDSERIRPDNDITWDREVVYIDILTCFQSQEQAKKHFMIQRLKGNQ